jgi:hypothetical protein
MSAVLSGRLVGGVKSRDDVDEVVSPQVVDAQTRSTQGCGNVAGPRQLDTSWVLGVDDDPAESCVDAELGCHPNRLIGGLGVGTAVQTDVAAPVGDEDE